MTPAQQAAVLLAGLVAAMPASAGDPLWTAKAPEPCRVVLEHATGDLEVHRVRASLQVLGERDAWTLETEAADGTIQVRSTPRAGGTGHADAMPLRIEVPRACELRVRGGAGRVDLHGRHHAPLHVETATGEIVLWAEDGADLRVALQTSGEMGVDYSIEIDHLRHQEPDKRGLVVLGDGAVQVHLASKRGAVRVLERGRAAGH